MQALLCCFVSSKLLLIVFVLVLFHFGLCDGACWQLAFCTLGLLDLLLCLLGGCPTGCCLQSKLLLSLGLFCRLLVKAGLLMLTIWNFAVFFC